MTFELTDSFLVATNLDRAWQFFSTASNLPRITPPDMHFNIVTPEPIVIEKNAIIDYTIKRFGLKLKWRTRIIEYELKSKFIDLQERGPYALWHHTHTLEASESGVRCGDLILYRLPLGPIGRAINALSVRKQLIEIFRFRREAIGKLLGTVTPIQREPMIRGVAVLDREILV